RLRLECNKLRAAAQAFPTRPFHREAALTVAAALKCDSEAALSLGTVQDKREHYFPVRTAHRRAFDYWRRLSKVSQPPAPPPSRPQPPRRYEKLEVAAFCQYGVTLRDVDGLPESERKRLAEVAG